MKTKTNRGRPKTGRITLTVRVLPETVEALTSASAGAKIGEYLDEIVKKISTKHAKPLA